MKKLILDPCLFELSCLRIPDELEHFLFLNDTITFVATHFDCGLDTYDGAPYGYNSKTKEWHPPITKSLTVRNRYSEIRKILQKLISLGEQLALITNPVDSCSLQFEEDSAAKDSFQQYLSHIIESNRIMDAVIILSRKNNACIPYVQVCHDEEFKTIASIFDPAVDCSGVVKTYLKRASQDSSAFPQKSACGMLNQRFKEEVIASPENASVYIKYGAETACRNGYKKDTVLSRKNTPYHVYKSESGVFFLSLDMEHGALELFEKHGSNAVHQGEYNYSCEQIKAASPNDHTLIL